MRISLEIWLLFKRKMLETVRQPVWVFMGLTTPLLYIALFSPLLGNLRDPPLNTGAVLDTFVPGVLTLLAFIGGTGAGYGVISELQSGIIERLRVSPVSRFSLLMGTILRDIVAFLVPSILVIFIAQLFGFKAHIGGLLVMLVLLSLLTAIVSAWSGSLGLILRQTSSMAALVAGLELPLTLLSGVLLPLSLGPEWLQAIAHINPLYYAVEASRVLGAGTIGSTEVFKAFAVIVPLTVITLFWATRVYRKAIS
ncbi:Daunorubicin/doxorubicin resistance ABC transporter permease protein DrrB [compost metagenome]